MGSPDEGVRGSSVLRDSSDPAARKKEDAQERAFLVGIDVRTRRGKGAVTAQAAAARDAVAQSENPSVSPRTRKDGAPAVSGTKPTVPEFDAEESIAELRALAESAGAKIVGQIVQRRDRIDPATLIGAGKLEEIAGAAASVNADLLLFDHDLSPSQQRNIEKIVDRRVIDRTQLILDIFARHARTREGQLQVELAQLQYMLPRLAGRGVEMSQLGGALGRVVPVKRNLKRIGGRSTGASGTSNSSWRMFGECGRSSGHGASRRRWRLWRWWVIRTRVSRHSSMR